MVMDNHCLLLGVDWRNGTSTTTNDESLCATLFFGHYGSGPFYANFEMKRWWYSFAVI